MNGSRIGAVVVAYLVLAFTTLFVITVVGYFVSPDPSNPDQGFGVGLAFIFMPPLIIALSTFAVMLWRDGASR